MIIVVISSGGVVTSVVNLVVVSNGVVVSTPMNYGIMYEIIQSFPELVIKLCKKTTCVYPPSPQKSLTRF